jgi:hypothetical protein
LHLFLVPRSPPIGCPSVCWSLMSLRLCLEKCPVHLKHRLLRPLSRGVLRPLKGLLSRGGCLLRLGRGPLSMPSLRRHSHLHRSLSLTHNKVLNFVPGLHEMLAIIPCLLIHPLSRRGPLGRLRPSLVSSTMRLGVIRLLKSGSTSTPTNTLRWSSPAMPSRLCWIIGLALLELVALILVLDIKFSLTTTLAAMSASLASGSAAIIAMPSAGSNLGTHLTNISISVRVTGNTLISLSCPSCHLENARVFVFRIFDH